MSMHMINHQQRLYGHHSKNKPTETLVDDLVSFEIITQPHLNIRPEFVHCGCKDLDQAQILSVHNFYNSQERERCLVELENSQWANFELGRDGIRGNRMMAMLEIDKYKIRQLQTLLMPQSLNL